MFAGFSFADDAKKPQEKREGRQRGERRQRGPRVPEGVVAERDIEYAKVGEKSLRLDVYRSETSDEKVAQPLIVWVHGGAWRAGSRKHCSAIRFAAKGYVVASISYRLSQEAIFPAQLHDCKAAIRFLRKNAARFGVDPKRFGAWGSSAGGHLVALLGTSGDVEAMEGEVGVTGVSSRVQAVCDFFGPTDFLQMDAHSPPKQRIVHDAPNSPESMLIGGPIQRNKKKTQAANPITYVSKDDPPFIIFHGDKDPLVPHHQSVLLDAALEKVGVDVTFHTVKGAGHGFGGRREVFEQVEAFFAKTLQGKSSSK